MCVVRRKETVVCCRSRGLRGYPGRDGERGARGIQGERGVPGEIGPRGQQGIQGEPGPAGSANLIDAMLAISPTNDPDKAICCICSGTKIPSYSILQLNSCNMPQTDFNNNCGAITFKTCTQTPNKHTYLITYNVTGKIEENDALTITPLVNGIAQPQWQATTASNSIDTTVTSSASFVYNNTFFDECHENAITFQLNTGCGKPARDVYGSYNVVQLS